MSADFQLWGTFSVADHKRPHAFVADVLVFDRLIVPVPAGDDDDRWASNNWDVDLQRRLLEVLRDGDAGRVLELPWDGWKRQQFQERTAELANAAAFDLTNIQSMARDNPDTPAQFLTRMVLQDAVSSERDEALLRHAAQGLPAEDVQVVAAYATPDRFAVETGAEQVHHPSPSDANLLTGFAWPFLVPAEDGRTGLDLLKRAVEFANEPEVQSYRQAYHHWRASMIRGSETPEHAADELHGHIAAYAEWAGKTKVQTRVATACAVVSVSAGLLTAVAFPLIGASAALASALVGAGSAGAGLVDYVNGRAFRRPSGAPPLAGALFWEAGKRLA